MTRKQYNSNKSLTPEVKWASFEKRIIWMNSLTYQPRLKKYLWFKFRLGPKTRIPRQAQSGIHAKIQSWSTISTVFSKSANLLDLPQKSTIRALFKATEIRRSEDLFTPSLPVDIETFTTWSLNSVDIFLQCCSIITYHNDSSWCERPVCCIRLHLDRSAAPRDSHLHRSPSSQCRKGNHHIHCWCGSCDHNLTS